MSASVVVWEWEDLPNLWIPYDVEVCEFIEGHYLSSPNLSCLNLGDVDYNLMVYDVNLIRLVQIRQETGRERRIRRQSYPANWPPGQGIMWQWWKDVMWVFYDIPSCHELEEAFQSKQSMVNLSLTPLNLPIAVDISDKKHMTQVNLETKYKRGVQRINCPPYPCHKPSNVVPVQGASIKSRNSHPPNAANSFASASSVPTKTNHQKKKILKLSNRLDASHKSKDKDTDSLSMFCSDVDSPPNEECSICFEKLADEPGFKSSNETFTHRVKKLDKCDHMFHSSCLLSMYQSGNKDGSLQCPTCKVIHGIKKGNQPDTGKMSVRMSHDSLPGHPDSGMITITYDFRPGIQGREHPNPGKTFTARGFPRVCYIPDGLKGRKVLKLLKIAWDRRLIFTVGSSSTTGEQGTVVWNEIHHKTEAFSNHSGHGYPDPNYLDNVLAELATHGVTEEDP